MGIQNCLPYNLSQVEALMTPKIGTKVAGISNAQTLPVQIAKLEEPNLE